MHSHTTYYFVRDGLVGAVPCHSHYATFPLFRICNEIYAGHVYCVGPPTGEMGTGGCVLCIVRSTRQETNTNKRVRSQEKQQKQKIKQRNIFNRHETKRKREREIVKYSHSMLSMQNALISNIVMAAVGNSTLEN